MYKILLNTFQGKNKTFYIIYSYRYLKPNGIKTYFSLGFLVAALGLLTFATGLSAVSAKNLTLL